MSKRQYSTILFCFTLYVLISASFTQNPEWINYTNSNPGLPNNNVNLIAIDGSGNKWLGTSHGGLFVYNEGGVVSIEPGREMFVENYSLHQNYPNPFNPTTTIQYDRPQRSDIQITALSGLKL